jgi:DNA (cytosine-5)-methyltransferase 1
MSPPTVASLFSGCGGLDLGFVQAGFQLVHAFDSDSAAVSVYQRNVHHAAECVDVRSEAFRTAVAALGAVDVVLGGFPCQGFSKAGPKCEQDERNTLYREMLHAVSVLKPSMFLAENVDGLRQNFQGKYVERIQSDFATLGYHVETRVLDAVEFGVPQHRRRIFFVGSLTSLKFDWPTPTHEPRSRNGEFRIHDELPLFDAARRTLERPRTIRDAIGDLTHVDDALPDHRVVKNWPRKYEHVFAAIKPGQKLCNVRHASTSVYTWQIPEAFGRTTTLQRLILETISKNRRHKQYGSIPNGNPLLPEVIAHLAGLSTESVQEQLDLLEHCGFVKRMGEKFDLKGAMFCSGLFKRPRWDEPAPTVLTNFHNPRYFLHPSENRPFSLRECARLQTFPDDFVFAVDGSDASLIDGYRLVGNAVPPTVGRAFGAAFMRTLGQPVLAAAIA